MGFAAARGGSRGEARSPSPSCGFPALPLLLHAVDLEKLVAISHVKRAVQNDVTSSSLAEMREGIERDIRKFRALLAAPQRRQV